MSTGGRSRQELSGALARNLRRGLLIHAARKLDAQDVIRDWLGGLIWSAKVRVAVDIDPYSFL